MNHSLRLTVITLLLFLAADGPGFGQAPIITTQPQDQTNAVGTAATFTVTATGNEPLAYQWQKYTTAFTNLADCTNATFVLTNVQAADEGDYRVVVTNLDGATNSSAAHLYVILPPEIIAGRPSDKAVASGTSVALSVSTTGTLPLSYQWQWEGVDLPDATNQLFTIQNVQVTNQGAYRVLVTNLVGAATSRVAMLMVAEGWVYTNAQGRRLPYRLFVPAQYDPAKKYPLVLFWNGIDGVGTNNLSQLADVGQYVLLSTPTQPSIRASSWRRSRRQFQGAAHSVSITTGWGHSGRNGRTPESAPNRVQH